MYETEMRDEVIVFRYNLGNYIWYEFVVRGYGIEVFEYVECLGEDFATYKIDEFINMWIEGKFNFLKKETIEWITSCWGV